MIQPLEVSAATFSKPSVQETAGRSRMGDAMPLVATALAASIAATDLDRWRDIGLSSWVTLIIRMFCECRATNGRAAGAAQLAPASPRRTLRRPDARGQHNY
jgi:hypothetical protein